MPSSLAGPLRRLAHSLSESADPTPESSAAGRQPARRISSIGQIALCTEVILAGLLSFHATRTYLITTWHPCQSLQNDKRQQSESAQATGTANNTINKNVTLLLQQYQQTQTLLNSATPAQKLRLNQQLRILTHGIDSFCRIRNHFLLQGLNSSLANHQLLLIPAQKGSSNAQGQPLTSTAMVANLISNLDTILQTIPDPSLSLNDNFAQGTFNRFIGGADNAAHNSPPVGSSNPAAAASQAATQAATESQNSIKTAISAHTNPP